MRLLMALGSVFFVIEMCAEGFIPSPELPVEANANSAEHGMEFVVLLLQVDYTGADKGVLELNQHVTSIVTNGQVIGFGDTFTYAPCCIGPPFEISLLSGGSGQGWLALPVAPDDAAPMLLLGTIENGVYFSLANEGEG